MSLHILSRSPAQNEHMIKPTTPMAIPAHKTVLLSVLMSESGRKASVEAGLEMFTVEPGGVVSGGRDWVIMTTFPVLLAVEPSLLLVSVVTSAAPWCPAAVPSSSRWEEVGFCLHASAATVT